MKQTKKHSKKTKGLKIKGSTWLLGGLAIAGAYGLYSMYGSSVLADVKPVKGTKPGAASGPPPLPTMPTGVIGSGPDLNGPRVQKGTVASTHTQNLIGIKFPGMVYARITKTDKDGYHIFMPPVSGIFTRRILAVGGRMWAEIKPDGMGI
jgi:hypothetical protein